jgi:hypothetical protein
MALRFPPPAADGLAAAAADPPLADEERMREIEEVRRCKFRAIFRLKCICNYSIRMSQTLRLVIGIDVFNVVRI